MIKRDKQKARDGQVKTYIRLKCIDEALRKASLERVKELFSDYR